MDIDNQNEALQNDNEATSQSFVDLLKTTADKMAENVTADNETEATADVKTANTDNAEGKTPELPQTVDNETQKPVGEVDNTATTEKINSPHSWNADLKQVWDTIPVEAQKAISEREKQMSDKLNQTSAEVGFAREIKQTLEPYDDVLTSLNAKPVEVVNTLLPVAKVLYTGSTLDKLKLIDQIATEHNIPLQVLFQQDNQDVLNKLQMQHLQHQNNYIQQTNQQLTQKQQAYTTQQTLSPVIQEFAKDKPDFELLRNDMAMIIENITVNNPNISPQDALNQAYEQAKWVNPQARQKELDKQYELREKQRLDSIKQKTAEKKNASMSLKNTGGQNSGNNNKNQNKSFAEIMKEKAQQFNKKV